MKGEFALAFNELLEERGLPREIIMEAVEAAMISAYRRTVNASSAQLVEVKVDEQTGDVTVYAEKEVVDEVQDQRTEVSLEEALKVDPEAEIGQLVVVESTPENFGRVAAQTARQIIHQKIREAERSAQLDYFIKQQGEIISGVVQAISPKEITLGLDLNAEGIMPRKEQIPGERYRTRDRVRALLLEVKDTPRGPQIIVSRAHRSFLRRLLENEVPEIYHGAVEIRSISREPGRRSKVAVSALQPGIDPVGACVGVRGIRIQAIVRELNSEKIDVIEWNLDPTVYIAKALSPARVHGVYLNEVSEGLKTATVVVPEDQLSLAIGRDGQNARLAAKLTGWRIDIKSLPEAAADIMYILQNDPQYETMAGREAESLIQAESVLAKKSEGRPVTPEEYRFLFEFVDRVERGAQRVREAEYQAEIQMIEEVRRAVPDAAFDTLIDDLGISPRWTILLANAGYSTIGDLMLQMQVNPEEIRNVKGLGPKAMSDIEEALGRVSFPEPEVPEVVAELEAEVEMEPGVEVTEPLMEVVEALPVLEPVEEVAEVEFVAKPTEEMEAEEAEVPPEEEVVEEELEFEKLFKYEDSIRKYVDEQIYEDEEQEQLMEKEEKKKKKQKYREVEYDPDSDVYISKKKRKRDQEGEWEEWS
ncbi:MAG: transcription termination factor NusA [Chloroflexota bacterium]